MDASEHGGEHRSHYYGRGNHGQPEIRLAKTRRMVRFKAQDGILALKMPPTTGPQGHRQWARSEELGFAMSRSVLFLTFVNKLSN